MIKLCPHSWSWGSLLHRHYSHQSAHHIPITTYQPISHIICYFQSRTFNNRQLQINEWLTLYTLNGTTFLVNPFQALSAPSITYLLQTAPSTLQRSYHWITFGLFIKFYVTKESWQACDVCNNRAHREASAALETFA